MLAFRLRNRYIALSAKGQDLRSTKRAGSCDGAASSPLPATGSAIGAPPMRNITSLADERARRARVPFAATVRHVVMGARTPAEHARVNDVLAAERKGCLTLSDAHEALRCLQRDQQASRAAA